MKTLVLALLAALVVQIPADPDGPLEPSVMNEVEHALARAPACATNAPSRTPKRSVWSGSDRIPNCVFNRGADGAGQAGQPERAVRPSPFPLGEGVFMW